MKPNSDPEPIYDIASAYQKLLEWGWPPSDLTVRQVQRWAHEKKANFFKNPVNGRLYIRQSDLRQVYTPEIQPVHTARH